jgi:hypothetical protein
MFISHRINFLDRHISEKIFQLADGIEFDIRDSGNDLIVQHDPFSSGQPFTEFLTFCPPNKFYIVNVKSEGIEHMVLSALEKYGISNFFLLDCSIPMMIRLGKSGEKRLAVRFSEYESLATVETMAPFVSWVWVDVFTRLPLTRMVEETIRGLGLKICLVSPELQGQQDKLLPYKDTLGQIQLDAVCSKEYNHDLWTTL